MRASLLEFRLRVVIEAAIFSLGLFAPWDRLGGMLRPAQSTWLALASLAARSGWMSFPQATVAILLVGILLTAAAAALRTWRSAYHGVPIILSGTMRGRTLAANGPYRYLRNPLALGTLLHALALALLMPPTAAIFTVGAITILQARLIAREEAFLNASLESSFDAYRAAVPRVFPSLRPRLPSAGAQPRWLQALIREAYIIGVALSFLLFGWRYNAHLLTRCVVIALGAGLIAHGFLPVLREQERIAETPAAGAGH